MAPTQKVDVAHVLIPRIFKLDGACAETILCCSPLDFQLFSVSALQKLMVDCFSPV
jgi:hypothetical protein